MPERERSSTEPQNVRGEKRESRRLSERESPTTNGTRRTRASPARPDLRGRWPARLVARWDQDVPPWSRWRTAGCHLALVRRVAERRPDVQFMTYNRAAYRCWLGSRVDSEALRTAWAVFRLG